MPLFSFPSFASIFFRVLALDFRFRFLGLVFSAYFCPTLPLRRIPAVSTRRYVLPPRSNSASIESRVVPGTSLTIDRVSPKSLLRRLDLGGRGRVGGEGRGREEKKQHSMWRRGAERVVGGVGFGAGVVGVDRVCLKTGPWGGHIVQKTTVSSGRWLGVGAGFGVGFGVRGRVGSIASFRRAY